jgi:hypothetical protein
VTGRLYSEVEAADATKWNVFLPTSIPIVLMVSGVSEMCASHAP